jgi:hypothetical protein
MISAEEQAQRQTALRALLAKPLLVAADDAESLMMVRRHLPTLSGWLRRETGWPRTRRRPGYSRSSRLLTTLPIPLAGTTGSRSAAVGTSLSAWPCRRSPAPMRRPRSAASPTTC